MTCHFEWLLPCPRTGVSPMSRRPLRTFAYRHHWFYNLVTTVSSVPAGGPGRLRSLCARQLRELLPEGAAVLDLCCGSGEASGPLLARGFAVTGLDCSAAALKTAAQACPALRTVQGFAEDPPLPAASFDGIQVSLALHEFDREPRLALLRSARRLLRPGGWLVALDLHPSGGAVGWLQDRFVAWFETATAVDFLASDLPADLAMVGFHNGHCRCEGFGSLQLVTAHREPEPPGTR